MSLPAIRQALAALLQSTPAVTVVTPNGSTPLAMQQALAYQPELPPEIVPCAWLGDSSGPIVQGSLEVWTHNLPITVAVHEAGQAEMERVSVESFMLAVVAHLRRDVSLRGTAAVCSITNYEEGQIVFKSKTYRGFTLSTAIEEKFEVANDYWPQAV